MYVCLNRIFEKKKKRIEELVMAAANFLKPDNMEDLNKLSVGQV